MHQQPPQATPEQEGKIQMTKKAYLKAQSKDWKNAKQQWKELLEILHENYKVKLEGNNEIFLNVPKQDEADIEIFLTSKQSVEKYHVQLWNYVFEDENQMRSKRLYTLTGVINYVDSLLEAVRMNEKMKKLG